MSISYWVDRITICCSHCHCIDEYTALWRRVGGRSIDREAQLQFSQIGFCAEKAFAFAHTNKFCGNEIMPCIIYVKSCQLNWHFFYPFVFVFVIVSWHSEKTWPDKRNNDKDNFCYVSRCKRVTRNRMVNDQWPIGHRCLMQLKWKIFLKISTIHASPLIGTQRNV